MYKLTEGPLQFLVGRSTIPYVSCIHEFESPRWYSMVITTAGIWVKTAVWVSKGVSGANAGGSSY